MTARTPYRLLAAGTCLLLAAGLSIADDAAVTIPLPRLSQPAFGGTPPSPHFFPARMARSKAPDPEAPAPANQSESPHEAPAERPNIADQTLLPLPDERPTLDTRASPHFFLGQARLQMPIRRAPWDQQSQSHAQPQPIDSPAVATSQASRPTVASEPSQPTIALAAEPTRSPATLTEPEKPASSLPAQLQSANLQPAAKLNLAAPHKILTSLPQRRSTDASANSATLKPAAVQTVAALDQDRLSRDGGPAAPLQPTEVFSVPRPDFFAEELEAAGLQARLPQPTSGSRSAKSLRPAEVASANSFADQVDPKFRLASLEQPLPGPPSQLQPAEVLPIPTPNSPTAPRIPELDQDRPIAALGTNITPSSGKLPTDLAAEHFAGDYPAWATRGYSEVAYFWDAPAFCYGPLRFEEVNLERYGYGCCHALQPFVSAAHLTGNLLALPYNMVNRPCWECIAPLGHYRPGSPVPYRKIWPEWDPFAASAECATIAGLILLIP